jgi:hypothetical protein
MSGYSGWAVGTLAASHAASVLDVGSTTSALRRPLDPCQRAHILRLETPSFWDDLQVPEQGASSSD